MNETKKEGSVVRIDIPFVDTHLQHVVKGRVYYVDLFDTHMVLQFAADVEERDDEDEIRWQERYQSLRQVVHRNRIASIMLLYNNKCKHWQLQLDVSGSHNEIWWMYPDHKEAKEAFEKIEAWYLDSLKM